MNMKKNSKHINFGKTFYSSEDKNRKKTSCVAMLRLGGVPCEAEGRQLSPSRTPPRLACNSSQPSPRAMPRTYTERPAETR